ncbi:hypothetical protein RO21_08990 [[Actinobacillus] muris]|uniref:UPF0310 protein RO21_08990 n=1 Tax=Muribacter muris TaxID=67855 RepID=A0A0J5P3T7_9PAST|nr:EVE domain-containing protein [Muribacter muris]KMK50946.1 hypothetical protein RO21_08990 [[Actinobacillus] muris] [Muribacter muris]
MMKFWVGVVSKEHVMIGVAGGFCQVCHGKQAPLNRMRKGDFLIYYSPKLQLGSEEKYQAFTAIGEITDDQAYQIKMTENFIPFRRNVNYLKIKRECPINIAKIHSEWKHYSGKLRFGHFEISKSFFDHIYQYMLDAQPDFKIPENLELFK